MYNNGKRNFPGSGKPFFYPFFFLLILLFSLTSKAQEIPDSVRRDTVDGTIRTQPVFMDTLPKGNADTVRPAYYRINGPYLRSYWHDFKGVISLPGQWKGRDWAKAGMVLGSAGLLAAVGDKPLKRLLLRNQSDLFDKTAAVFYPVGNTFPPFFLAGLYVTGVVTKSRRLEHVSLAAAKGLFLSTVVYTTTKAIVRRQRPLRSENNLEFVTPFTHSEYSSFPSGHTNTAFATATAFALEYRDKKWVPWVAYPIATITSVARAYQNRHWASDLLIGAAIGHFVTRGIYLVQDRRRGGGSFKTY